MADEDTAPSKIEKKKRNTTAGQRAALEKGREKLLAARAAKSAEKARRTLEIEDDPVKAIDEPPAAKPAPRVKKVQRVVVEESDTESEPEIVVTRRRKPSSAKKAVKKVVYVDESSESDGDGDEVPVRARRTAPAKAPPKSTPQPKEPEFRVMFF